jgi:hypothetical protein
LLISALKLFIGGSKCSAFRFIFSRKARCNWLSWLCPNVSHKS